MSTSSRSDPKNVAILIAAINAFLVAVPTLLLSFTGNTDKVTSLTVMFDEEGIAALANPGQTRDFFRFAFLFVFFFSFGYYRIYVDGAINQPLMVFLGGSAKVLVSMLLTHWSIQGHAKRSLVFTGALPDFALGLYYLKIWV